MNRPTCFTPWQQPGAPAAEGSRTRDQPPCGGRRHYFGCAKVYHTDCCGRLDDWSSRSPSVRRSFGSASQPAAQPQLCCFKERCLCANRAGRSRSQGIHQRLVRECCVRVRQAVTSKSRSVLLFQQKSSRGGQPDSVKDKCVTVQAHYHARRNSNVRHNPKKIIRGLTFPSISVGHHRHQHADCDPVARGFGWSAVRRRVHPFDSSVCKSSAPSPRVD
jgi:hypothetical protein